MEWRDDGYNYDDKNNRVGYSGKPVSRSTGAGFLGKLAVVCLLIYGGKSIFGPMPKRVSEGFDILFQVILYAGLLIVAIKLLRWFLKNR